MMAVFEPLYQSQLFNPRYNLRKLIFHRSPGGDKWLPNG
jgi:hypothetical protein